MTMPLRPQNQPYSGTYIIAQTRQNKEEFVRLADQDCAVTRVMGGVLAEQNNPETLRNVLDIACGPGVWAIEMAQKYPHMSLVGIDANISIIEYARAQAAAYQINDRVKFYAMDALRVLEFPDSSFDLVNLRFVLSFLRTWDWTKLLRQVQRLLRPGGIIRLTDEEVIHQSNSAMAMQFCEMLQNALFRSGHLFAQESTGLTAYLAPLLTQHGYEQIETKIYNLHFRGGTPEGEAYAQGAGYTMRMLRPFLQKWSDMGNDFNLMYQQIAEESRQPDFKVTWNLHTVWGTKPLQLEPPTIDRPGL